MKDKSEVQSGFQKNDPMLYWLPKNQLWINEYYFHRGLIVLGDESYQPPTNRELKIGGRTFVFSDLEKPDDRALKKSCLLLNTLLRKKDDAYDPTKVYALFNTKRREEQFIPVQLVKSKKSVYVYPWSDKKLPYNFNGFKQFVTAGCMFGSNLKGVLNDGTQISLINHELILKSGQQITSINHNLEENPFEIVFLNEFKKFCRMMKTMATPDTKPQILFHLPAEDYLLFVMKLYVNNQINKPALEDFLKILIAKKEDYIKKTSNICESLDMSILFTSPFANLFNQISPGIDSILTHFNIEQIANSSPENLKYQEQQLVIKCMSLLRSNSINKELQKEWIRFLDHTKISEAITNIEALFKIGNTVVLATSTQGKNHHETCSLLPLSEKQIQVQYDATRRNIVKDLPSIVNLTTFDPIISYSSITKGLLFYFTHSLGELGRFITENKIMKQASQNIGFFSQGQDNRSKSILETASAFGYRTTSSSTLSMPKPPVMILRDYRLNNDYPALSQYPYLY